METSSDKQNGGGGAAVKKGCVILIATVLSLLPPLSLLLLARLSVARYFLSLHIDKNIFLAVYLLIQCKTALIFTSLITTIAIATLVESLTGKIPYLLITQRRRFYVAWVVLFLLHLCLSLGFDEEIIIYSAGHLVFVRRAVLVVGLHEMVVFWRGSVVKPVVEGVVLGFSDEGLWWVEKVVSGVALGYLWWRRLREEAEVLVVLPWVRAEVEVVDVVGWFLYYLTAAIGGVKVVKGGFWVANLLVNLFRYHSRVQEERNQLAAEE